MLIDWFTVLAQIVNFLILIWLMKRYLYHPILAAIDAREQRIAAQLADAASQQQQALKERDLYQQKNQTLDNERATLLKEAQDNAASERQHLLETAALEADALRERRNAALQQESKTVQRDLAAVIQNEAFAIARQTLSELADVELEARMNALFLAHINALDPHSKTALLSAIHSAPGSISVNSAFTLTAAQQQAISQVVSELAGTAVKIRFDLVPGLIAGLELLADGQKLAWSVAGYLSALDSHISDIVAPVTGGATP